jgi:predicted ArsR family transcriptional regulator
MSGGPRPRITTDDVLAIFEDNDDKCEPFTAPEIADQFNCHRNTARGKLNDLVELGDLMTKKAGSGRVYWQPCHKE